MPEADIATLLAFFKAMANESRLRIIGLVAERERSVQELAELLDLKEPTVSHHLAALKALDLLHVRVEGVTHWHRLRPEGLHDFNRALFDQKDLTALAKPEQTWEEKVIANFLLPDGTLKTLPASRRKRWVLLKWQMSGFEEGRRYPEKEVNAILQRRHPDAATMRREMIGWKMLAREDNIYWRLPEDQWEAA